MVWKPRSGQSYSEERGDTLATAVKRSVEYLSRASRCCYIGVQDPERISRCDEGERSSFLRADGAAPSYTTIQTCFPSPAVFNLRRNPGPHTYLYKFRKECRGVVRRSRPVAPCKRGSRVLCGHPNLSSLSYGPAVFNLRTDLVPHEPRGRNRKDFNTAVALSKSL